jgi:hypothetical protein
MVIQHSRVPSPLRGKVREGVSRKVGACGYPLSNSPPQGTRKGGESRPLDHLVGKREQLRRDVETERFSRIEVDD